MIFTIAKFYKKVATYKKYRVHHIYFKIFLLMTELNYRLPNRAEKASY